MPIQTECPECGKKYRFGDDRAGDTVDCRECGAEIDIPGGRRRSPGATKGKKRKKQESGVAPAVLIGGGVGGVVVVGLIAALMMRGGGPPAAPPANNNPQIAAAPNNVAPGAPTTPGTPTPNGAVPNAVPQAVPANPPANPVAPVNPAVPNQANAVPVGPRVGAGFQPAGGSDEGFLPVKDWKVAVDPATDPISGEVEKDFDIKMTASYLDDDYVLFPHQPSPIVAVGKNSSGGKDQRDIWNLLTGTKVGTIKGPTISGSNVGLSSDGSLIAWFRHQGTGGGVEVYDIKAKKTLGAVAVDSRQFNVGSVAMPNKHRLVAASNVHRGLVSWKMPTGELERDIKLGDKGQPATHITFSPGGRFVAVLADYLTSQIDFYDFESGEKVGTFAFAKRGPNLFGMAFSHDGKEFAAAYAQSFSDKPERFAIWKVNDGSLVSDFTVPNEDNRKTELLNSKGSLQWFPDGKRFLFNGLHVVDRESKAIVYSFDKPSLDHDTGRTRRVVSNTTIAAWEGNKQTATIKPMKLSTEDIAKAKAVTESGGLMFDVKLPPLTAFDRGKAKDQSTVAGAWSVTPDVPEKAAALGDSINLQPSDGRPREIEFSRTSAGIVCVRMSLEEETSKDTTRALVPDFHMVLGEGRSRTRVRFRPIPCGKNWIDVYDATKKQFVKRIDIPFACELMAVSPDGQRVLVQAVGGEGRLDVFSMDGRPVAACRPFQDEADKAEREIAKAVFADNDTVIAASMDDRLIAFKLPTCEPLYSSKDGGEVAISPGGKWLASCAEGVVHFRDAITGEGKGSVTAEGEVVAMSFAPKGDRLAILTRSKKGNAVIVVDLASGTPTSTPVPQALLPVVWVGDNELILGAPPATGIEATKRGVNVDQAAMLIDLNRKAVLWTYLYGTADNVCFGDKTFDGRLWIAGPTGKGSSRQLSAVSLPEASVKKQVGDKQLESSAIVKPGASVSLSLAIAESAEVKDFSKRARSIVEQLVKDNGFTLKENEPLKLVVSVAAPTSVGPLQLSLTTLGAGVNRQMINVDGKKVTVRLAYELAGKTVWESKLEVSNDFFGLQRIGPNESPQLVLDRGMWERVLSLIQNNLPPSHVFSPEASRGLGASRLTGAGPVPANR